MTEAESKIAEFFVQREGEGVLKTIRDVDFINSGIMDSLDMVSLAVHIEKKFNVKLDLSDAKVLQAIRRFDSLVSLVVKR